MKPITYTLDGENIVIPPDYAHLVKMKTRKDLYLEYDINPWTFRRRMLDHRVVLTQKGILPICDVLRVYRALGWPPKMRNTHPSPPPSTS